MQVNYVKNEKRQKTEQNIEKKKKMIKLKIGRENDEI